MGIYDNVKMACKNKGISINKLEQKLGFARSSISKFNTNIPSIEKMSQIAKELDVTVDYLMTGKEPNKTESELTAKDRRDIAKDLDRIMGEIRNGQDGPLYYNGEEIDEASINLLQNAIEFALTQTKKINKVKYNPNKNKK